MASKEFNFSKSVNDRLLEGKHQSKKNRNKIKKNLIRKHEQCMRLHGEYGSKSDTLFDSVHCHSKHQHDSKNIEQIDKQFKVMKEKNSLMGVQFCLDNNLEFDTDVLLKLIEDRSRGFGDEHSSLSSSEEEDSSSEMMKTITPQIIMIYTMIL